jgi:hypothetical protein
MHSCSLSLNLFESDNFKRFFRKVEGRVFDILHPPLFIGTSCQEHSLEGFSSRPIVQTGANLHPSDIGENESFVELLTPRSLSPPFQGNREAGRD